MEKRALRRVKISVFYIGIEEMETGKERKRKGRREEETRAEWRERRVYGYM